MFPAGMSLQFSFTIPPAGSGSGAIEHLPCASPPLPPPFGPGSPVGGDPGGGSAGGGSPGSGRPGGGSPGSGSPGSGPHPRPVPVPAAKAAAKAVPKARGKARIPIILLSVTSILHWAWQCPICRFVRLRRGHLVREQLAELLPVCLTGTQLLHVFTGMQLLHVVTCHQLKCELRLR